MLSHFHFQVMNFISAMAASIASSKSSQQQDELLQDFSPNRTDQRTCRIQPEQPPLSLTGNDYVRVWLPPPSTLISNLNLIAFSKNLDALGPDHKSIRDFGNFVARFESPSAKALEHYKLHKTRLALSECSLTYADFRHAVNHQIDHASSIWQNN